MERSNPILLVVDAVLHTKPSQIQIAEQVAEVAPKCNGMDRKYCFAYDIVDMPVMIEIVPEILLVQMNYCNEYDLPMFQQRLLHPDVHSYSIEEREKKKRFFFFNYYYYFLNSYSKEENIE